MDQVYRCCAGLDVHKDRVWACVRVEGVEHIEKFGTSSGELLRLGDWMAALGVTIVAMESTGVYWKPVWNLLEDRFELMLVNAHHIKNVPGRKTDVCDCGWIAQLLEHGLLRPSFVPDRPQRELRDLTRQRTQLLGDRARVINRVQKTLEDANIKLASVASDIAGKSGRAILNALVDGKLSPEQMAELVDKRMEKKKPALIEALVGRVTEHHRFMLRSLLRQMDDLDSLLEKFDQRIEEVMSPFERDLVKLLDDVPGFDLRTGQNFLAEVGSNMNRFPSAQHLASWAGLCPGNNQSGGKRRGGKTRKANRWLKATLTQAAWGARNTRRSYLSARHRRLTTRRGKKRASIAIAHSQLRICYHLLSNFNQYRDLGVDYLKTESTEEQKAQQMVRRLKRLGYDVQLERRAA